MAKTSEYSKILAAIARADEAGELTEDEWSAALKRSRRIVPPSFLEALYNFARPEWALGATDRNHP